MGMKNYLEQAGLADVNLLDPDLNMLDFTNAELKELLHAMFKCLGIPDAFFISHEALSELLSDIETLYHPNPFHNFAHACTVTHVVFISLFHIPNLSQYFFLQDVTALLLAAIAHDIQHTGQNNTFHIQSVSSHAIQYNDMSILEQHSTSTFFKLITRKHQVLSALSPQEFSEVRQVVVRCIMDTDLSHHNLLISQFSSHVHLSFSRESLDDRKQLASVILHAADLSNPTRRFDQAGAWAALLTREFSAQAQLERSLSLNVAPFMENQGQMGLIQNELHFISTFVEPLWSLVVALFPTLRYRLTTLDTNMQKYRADILKFEEAAHEKYIVRSSTTGAIPRSVTSINHLSVHYLINTSPDSSPRSDPGDHSFAQAGKESGSRHRRKTALAAQLWGHLSRQDTPSPSRFASSAYQTGGGVHSRETRRIRSKGVGRLSLGDIPANTAGKLDDQTAQLGISILSRGGNIERSVSLSRLGAPKTRQRSLSSRWTDDGTTMDSQASPKLSQGSR